MTDNEKAILKNVINKLIDSGLERRNSICESITLLRMDGKISEHKKDFIKNFIRKNRPKWYNWSFWHPAFTDEIYWWKQNESGKQQRIKFLKRLLKKLS
ncbi:MAG TPA: hypothetical protein PLN38_08280 [Chitinophagales bacterium]|nr:hypothetical protein [Chitinophagales bacterium]